MSTHLMKTQLIILSLRLLLPLVDLVINAIRSIVRFTRWLTELVIDPKEVATAFEDESRE